MKKKMLMLWIIVFFLIWLGIFLSHFVSIRSGTCGFVRIWNTVYFSYSWSLWEKIYTESPEYFKFLYYDDVRTVDMWTLCFYVDKENLYWDAEAVYSGFDYDTFKVLTGEVFYVDENGVTGSSFSSTCIWWGWCFEDKDAVYYSERGSPEGNSHWFIRNTDKIFPDVWNYDYIRNKVNQY